MMTADPIAATFAQVVAVLRAQDVDGFRALAVRDAPPQDALFRKNAARLAEGGLTLRLTRVDQAEDAADVLFDVVNGAGKLVESGKMTLTREPEGWRVRAL